MTCRRRRYESYHLCYRSCGHDMRYAIDSTKLQRELGGEPLLQFEEGFEKTVKWYLDNEMWLDNVTGGDYQTYYENMYHPK